MKQSSVYGGVPVRRYLVPVLALLCLLFSQTLFAHTVNSYSGVCGSGPKYTVTASVSSVNSSSNYRWQWKNSSGSWVCFVNGANTINGTSYNVSGAVYNLTTNPGSLVFTNPGAGLQGLEIRMVISDGSGVNPCNLPSGNTWTSTTNHFINITNTACAGCPSLSITECEININGTWSVLSSCAATVAAGSSVYLSVNPNTFPSGYTQTWSGPNSYTATGNDAFISNSISSANAGTYTITVSNGACSVTKSITLNVSGSTTCSCPNNLVLNPSFESGTTSWNWSGGNFSAGGGAVKCGTKSGDFEITNTSNNWVSQTIGTNLAPGTVINASTYAGTHNNSYYHQVAIDFFDANWNWMSSSSVEVNKVLSNSPSGPQYYSWTAVVPQGAKYTNVSFSGNGSWIKTDQWCVTVTPPGSISDRVWNDTDRDGIQDAGELGLAGITVSLYDNAGILIGSTVTDAYGLYKFANLPVSSTGINYQVRFSLAEGYVFSPLNADATGVPGAVNSDANTTTGRTGNITLTTAVPNVTYVDAGMYLTVPNRIGDFIWNDFNKDGDQDAGEPGIAGIVVTLYDNAGNPIRTTITDNNGHYEFNDVPSGTYTIGITPPAGYQFSPMDQGGDDAKDSDFNTTTGRTNSFTFTGGVNLTFDGGLNVSDGTTASVGDFVWVDLNNDNLQDSNEPGVPGVTVQLYNSANVLVAMTTTNGLGYYIFNGVAPGSYYVKFSNTPVGYNFVTADAGDDYKDSDVTNANGAGTTATFTVAAGTNTMTYDAGIRSSTGVNSLGDFVWYDSDKDGIQDAGEAGVPGITVTLYNASTGAALKTTTTNGQGLYMFTGLAAGSYIVGFSNVPAGYGFTTQDAGPDAADSDPNPNTGRTGIITISGTGNVITTVDGGLVSKPNVFDTKGSIGDYVWNDLNNNGIQDAGEPGVTGVTVTLYAGDGTTVIATTTTNALGAYLFTNLSAGNYVVGFSGLPAGYSLSALPNAGTDDAKDSDADPATGKTTAITLLPGEINTTIDAGIRNATTSARLGNFVWNDVNGNGFQDAGEPGVPGVSVYLLNSAGTVLKNTVTDATGLYMFTDLAAGTYRVSFGNLPAGFTATTKDAAPVNNNTDSDGDVTTLTTDLITLAAGAADMTWDLGIRSTTTASVGDYVWSDDDADGQQDATEKGIAGVLVTLYNSSGVAVASTVTDANGKYLFVNVTPGTYTVGFSGIPSGSSFTSKDTGADVSDSDVNPATGRTDAFTLAAGQSNMTIDAGLVTRYAAVGNYVWHDLNSDGIQDPDELPVAGVTVVLYNSANQPVASAVTDGNGYYLINNIPVPAGGLSYKIGFTDIPASYVFTEKNVETSTTENNSDADQTTGLTDAFTLSPGQTRLDIDAGLIRLISIKGNVWHDVNAMADGFVNNSGAAQTPPAVGIPVGLRVYLVNNSTGLVEDVTFVNTTTGKFQFDNISPNNVYSLILSSANGIIGNPPPAQILPSGWQNTGQKNANPPNSPTGNDGLNDGKIVVPVDYMDIIELNFGIRLKGGDTVLG